LRFAATIATELRAAMRLIEDVSPSIGNALGIADVRNA